MRTLLLFCLLSLAAQAQDVDHLLWLRPATQVTNLELDPAGGIACSTPSLSEGQIWRLVPAGGGFHLRCAGNGREQDLSWADGRPLAVPSPGPVWSLRDPWGNGEHWQLLLGQSCLDLQADGRFLLLSAELPPEQLTGWLLLPRRRLGAAPPDRDELLRSDHQGSTIDWRVVIEGLEGYLEPDLGAAVVERFARGTVLTADYGRGGSDEVFWNMVDEEGRAWMQVKRAGKPSVWVRANGKFLAKVGPR